MTRRDVISNTEHVRLWEYRVRAKHAADFERVYGAAGEWAGLFRRAEGYRGTTLLRDARDPERFVTIDRWESKAAWDAFSEQFGDAYRELDSRCERWTRLEAEIGSFETSPAGGGADVWSVPGVTAITSRGGRPLLRVATRADVPGIQRVRRAVRENRLVSGVISDEEVVRSIETVGRGWVVEAEGDVVGFAIGNAQDGNIWALFVDPELEGLGHGRRLHDVMIAWLFSRGLRKLWLTTDPETRAAEFYARAGWTLRGRAENGELRFEKEAPTAPAAPASNAEAHPHGAVTLPPRALFLRSVRLGFGLWTDQDGPLARALWGDARVMQFLGGAFSDAQCNERLRREIGLAAVYGVQYWPIFRLENGAHVGCCGLWPRADDVLQIGFHLRPEHWGLGYASEAARAVTSFAFDALGVRVLFAGHHPENDASGRVLERLGFRRAGRIFYVPTTLMHPCYEATRADFERASPPPRVRAAGG